MKQGVRSSCLTILRPGALLARLRMPNLPPVHRPPGWRPPVPFRNSIGKRAGAAVGGRPWARLRKRILTAEPLCRPCSKHGRVTAATEIDHIRPRAQGGSNDPDNLQPICHACHVAKTTAEALTARRAVADDA